MSEPTAVKRTRHFTPAVFWPSVALILVFVLLAAAEPEGHAAESLTDCHHDRPGDTTMLEALSLRIYFSGEPLETLSPGAEAV